jgi:uncharacterized protein (TIGR03437 family)
MKFLSQFLAIVLAAGMFLASAPAVQAQVQSATTVSTSPPGGQFSVDGMSYSAAMTAIWPQGSKHTLYAMPQQNSSVYNTQYTFQGWQWAGGAMVGNPVVVTADPSITSYQAIFTVQYGLNILFNPCDPTAICNGPGTISVNGTTIATSQEIYEPAQGAVVLQAFPNTGYVFVGWQSGSAQLIQGFQTTITMNGPVTVSALFAPVQFVNLATIPAGLLLLADRTEVPTPTAMQWGLNTVHTLAALSPQQDTQGNYWIFSSWSDGGALQHAYTVPGYAATTVTATFVPGVPVEFLTSPQGLSLSVDGQSNWSSYTFEWAAGQTHTVQAPSTQTDSRGNLWGFANWSNGGAQTQSITVPQSAVGGGMRLVANYNQLGHITVTSALAGLSVTVNGTACAVPCDIQQPLGTQLTIAAPASVPLAAGSRQDFLGWSNGAGTGPLSVTLGADSITVAANYHQMNYLATAAAPSGAASWSLQPASPDGFYDSQTNVAINVTALPGFRFRSWSGDLSGSTPSGTVPMSAPRAVQASFDKVPYIVPTGVANGAGSTPQTGLAAGSVVSIFGANLANGVALGPSSPMTQTLAGTTVLLGSRLLPLFFVSPAQINFQLPSDVPSGAQTLTVSTQGQPDVQASFNVVQDAPGLFSSAVNGQTYAVATHADGSPVTLAAPVQQGETITLYGTGFGPSTPARPFGFAVPQSPAYVLNDPATIQIGSAAPVAPSAAFAVAGSVGVDAVQFTLGTDAPSSTSAQLTITINGQVSNMVLLPIQ